MPLDPQVEALLSQIAASGAPPFASMTVDEARSMAGGMALMGGEQVPVASVRDITIPVDGATIGARVYTPDGDAPQPLVVFFHGGGFVIGDLDSHDNLARTLCRDAQAVVVAVDYRMGPEHRFPTAPNDCFAATRWVAEHAAELGGDASRLAVCGDSAGGNLSAVVTQMARDAGGPAIRFAALIYPTVDMTLTGGSLEENAKGYFLEKDDMDWFMSHYLNSDDDRPNLLASPARHPNLAGLPSCFITTCEFDPLRDEGEAYGASLRANGVAAENTRYDGLIHGAASMGGLVDGGRRMLADVADHLRVALH
jgi:acetyl esterase/lipase